MSERQVAVRDYRQEADAAFASDIVRFLCRRAGSRNWVEQVRAVVVDWTACVLHDGATVTARGEDYLVKTPDVTLVCRPHERERSGAPS